MKLSFIVPTLTQGGAERVVSVYANHLSTFKEHAISIILFSSTNIRYEISGNVTLYTCTNEKRKSLFSKIVNLRKILKKTKPDVCISFLWQASFLTYFSLLFLPITHITTERNNPYYEPRNPLFRFFRNWVIGRSDGCIFQTKLASLYFSKKVRSKGIILPNPIVSRYSDFIPYSERRKVITTIGRLTKQKNQRFLIDAFSRIASKIPEYRLEIYGSGEEDQNLRHYCKELGIEGRVDIFPWTDNVLEFLRTSTLFALTSLYEGYPNVLIEAMSVGTTCISLNCPMGPAEIIVNNKNGVLINDKSALRFSETMLSLLQDTDKSERLAIEGRKVIESHSITCLSLKLLDFINRRMGVISR